jgi:acyl-CoA dehydrogenase
MKRFDVLTSTQGMPCDVVAHAQHAAMEKRFGVYPPVIDDLKEKAKKLGLWNIFLSKTHYTEGAGLTNLEYGLVAMILGKSSLASEVFRLHNVRF